MFHSELGGYLIVVTSVRLAVGYISSIKELIGFRMELSAQQPEFSKEKVY